MAARTSDNGTYVKLIPHIVLGQYGGLKLILNRMESFQAVKGVGSDEGVAVGDVLLPASSLPFTVLLGIVLTVELSEGDCVGIFLMPQIKFCDALLVLVYFVCSRVTDHDAPHQADADKCADTYDYREIELD